MAIQEVMAHGNIGRDPEHKFLQSGAEVTNTSLAVTEKWTDKSGEKREKTTWFELQFWGPKAAIAAQYLKKGKELIVWGTVSTHAYLDKQGAPQAKLELTVTRFDFAGGRDDREDGGNAQQNDYDAPPPSNADDIPF